MSTEFDPKLFGGVGARETMTITPSQIGRMPDGLADGADDAPFTLEDLANIDVSMSDATTILAAGLSPQGWYQTDPTRFGEMSVRPRELEEKDAYDVVTGKRRVIAFSGRAAAVIRDRKTGKSAEVEARIEFEIAAGAANQRNKRNFETGEEMAGPDLRSKLFAQAMSTFKQTYKEGPASLAALCEFLKVGVYRINMLAMGVPTERNPTPDGDPRNLVFVIAPVKTGRRG